MPSRPDILCILDKELAEGGCLCFLREKMFNVTSIFVSLYMCQILISVISGKFESSSLPNYV